MRQVLKHSRSIVVKIGTEIVHSVDGMLAMGQIGAIVEQIAILHMQGIRVVIVSSGSVAIGKMMLQRQYLLSGSMQSHLGGRVGHDVNFDEKTCAAAGQSGLQSLYEILFAQYHLQCSQILASDADFRDPVIRKTLKETMQSLLQVGIIPIVNENDVITKRRVPLVDKHTRIAWDNDSLASLFAIELNSDLLITLTDTDGVYRRDKDGGKEMIHEFQPNDSCVMFENSRVGPVGQEEKVMSSIQAVNSGFVKAAIIAKAEPHCLIDIIKGKRLGTLFLLRGGARYDTLKVFDKGDCISDQKHPSKL
uniref:Delta1pyrroline5carboxylate synthetase putative n=1 Tax=Albugo laibachii Nc14 TaxID=890382 RepID=F0WIY1_9STRA|nr:delta1pyrroline5carboxylate synthetase putative [Albugo laibachii Nc14]|eukprot:CCA21227.1 delta1pyrroline5carboxylate synthetase putative [Albugo laibachii Nc14]